MTDTKKRILNFDLPYASTRFTFPWNKKLLNKIKALKIKHTSS